MIEISPTIRGRFGSLVQLPESPTKLRGWKYLGQTQEEREVGEAGQNLIIAHFTFDNYYRADKGKLRLLQIQAN
jgi:hypothetical protein